MKLPPDSVIAEEKITRYLLVPLRATLKKMRRNFSMISKRRSSRWIPSPREITSLADISRFAAHCAGRTGWL